MPVRPVSAAGCRIEPPVSVPVAADMKRAATAAAEPPDDPPGTQSPFHGLRTGPYQLVSFDEPIANSSMLVLPIVTQPAAASRATTVASYGATKLLRIFEPQLVCTPCVQKMSLCAMGMPASVPPLPAASARSAARACSSASSSVTVMKLLSFESCPSMRPRQ